MKHLILAAMLCAVPAFAQEEVKLDSDSAMINYFLGTNVGESFKRLRLEMENEAFMRGVKDVMEGRELALDEKTLEPVLRAHTEKLEKEMMAEMEAERAALEEKWAETKPVNKKMIDAFKADSSVKKTESGIKYKMVREGEGESPVASDAVEVHYKGMLEDGSIFDSSYDRNESAKFRLTDVVPGWSESVQLMKAGGKINVLIPSDLAYGEDGRGDVIPPNSPLFFEIELITIL